MKCKDIFDKLGDYLDQELDGDICKEIESHIKDCEPCIAFINTLKKTVELFHSVAKPDEPQIPKPVATNLMEFLRKEISSEGK